LPQSHRGLGAQEVRPGCICWYSPASPPTTQLVALREPVSCRAVSAPNLALHVASSFARPCCLPCAPLAAETTSHSRRPRSSSPAAFGPVKRCPKKRAATMSKFLLSMLESRAFFLVGHHTLQQGTLHRYITAPQPETAASLGEIARRKRAASARAVSDPLSQYGHAMLASYRGSGCGGGGDRPRSERA